MITSQRHGMTQIAGGLIILILHYFRHFIRVNTGPSERHFTYKKEKKIYGTGKGTGWSPNLWTGTNDVIIEVMFQNCPHILHRNPMNTVESRRNTDAFMTGRIETCKMLQNR